MAVRYLSAENLDSDDFGVPFTQEEGEFVYDGRVKGGTAWATMSEITFEIYGVGVGLGLGQKYKRNDEGHLIMVDAK